MPNDAELARTGITLHNGFCNASMCSPSRATLFTGLYPAEHGVTLTLTQADLRPTRATRRTVRRRSPRSCVREAPRLAGGC